MFKNWLYRHLPRHRQSWFASQLDGVCRGIHRAYENVNYDFNENGERFVLEMLATEEPHAVTVFDVGANVGEWSTMAAQLLPKASIHAFEIVPVTFELMRKATIETGRVHAHAFGLSDSIGEIPVYFPKDLSVVASSVPGIAKMMLDVETELLQGKVTTGELFCAEARIGRIDFLKIDVEGFEPQVLRGFLSKLAAGDIGMIQFEYGYANAMTRFLLRDFYDLLKPHGMSIGKIFPDHVEFRDYDVRHEDFLGPNYLAVLSSNTRLLKVLGG